MKTYTLTITEEQARTISTACDLLFRLGIGQWPEFISHLPGSTAVRRDNLEDALNPIMANWFTGMFGGHSINGWNSSLGVGNPHVSEQAHIAHDLHLTIRHRLAWDNATAKGITDGTERHWPEMMTVDYDEPMLYSKQPEATIQATQETQHE